MYFLFSRTRSLVRRGQDFVEKTSERLRGQNGTGEKRGVPGGRRYGCVHGDRFEDTQGSEERATRRRRTIAVGHVPRCGHGEGKGTNSRNTPAFVYVNYRFNGPIKPRTLYYNRFARTLGFCPNKIPSREYTTDPVCRPN